MTKPSAKVLRRKVLQINAEEVVPGDLILLDAGDSVPADARLIESASLRTNESALTGSQHPWKRSRCNKGPRGSNWRPEKHALWALP